MARLRRTRIVMFRVTEAEYERLKTASADAGAGSLSGYTRSELLSSIETDSKDMTEHDRFHAIDEKLGDLQNSLRRIRDVLMNAVGKGTSGIL